MSGNDPMGDGGVVTLADRLDDLLVRLEMWRPRPPVVLLLSVLLLAAAAAWLLTRPEEATAIDDLIPLAEGARSPTGSDQAGDLAVPSGGDGDGNRQVGGAGAEFISSSETDPGSDSAFEPDAEEIVVHVAGAVRRPGLVTLEPGSRIRDAIDAAGGAVAGADVHRLNLAAPVVDGMQVRIPETEDEVPATELVQVPSVSGSAPEGVAGPVNLNTASAVELQTLPGVGPAIAAAIVAWREEQGLFRSVEQLDAVPGIGPAKMAVLRDQVIV